MAIKFTTTAKSGKTANILVYSRSGLGKTVLASTAPSPIIISSERGLMSIAEFDIPVIEVSTLEDFKDAYKFVMSNGKKYETVVIDSISDIAESVLSDFLENVRDPRQAYGKLNQGIAKMIRKFRDMEKHTYFIAKADTFESASGMQCMRPKMPGRTLTADLPFFFDQCLVLRLGEANRKNDDGEDEKYTYRFLQTAPDLTYEAKDRSDQLNAKEKPDLTYLFKKIKGKNKSKTKKEK